jgi:serine/threonine protein kinase
METLLGYPVRTSVVHPGDKIDGRYHILSVIADGGMGTVFLAEHMLIKRRVAVKVLHPELVGDLAMIRRFMNEATAAGSLGHPNIVECTDMGFTTMRVPYIVFEYLEGVLLTEEVYRVRGMTPRRTLRIAKQIASALEASHAAGIVHLDLKSDNIFLVDRDGVADHVKVLDFGIAKFMEADPDNTQRNLVIGTPEFMSPEQITNPAGVDGRADVWALGVVMYEMLTARRPFNMTEGPRLLLHRIVHELPPAMARKTIPAELETMILEKMLAKDPAQRFASIAECRQAIEALLRTLESSGDSIAPPQPQPSPESSWPDEEIFITSLEPPATELAPAPAPRPPRPSNGLRHPPAPQRRWPTGLLALALVAGAGGGGLLYAEQRIVSSIDDSAVKSLEATAAEISAVLDTSLRSAKTRASSMATSSVLRAPMETDGKQILDVIRDERLLVPGSGDTIELSLTRDGRSPRVVRVPELAESLGVLPEQPRLDVTRTGLRLIATAPIVRQDGEPGGVVAVASAVDLGPVRGRLSVDALGATLTGLDKPLELLPRQEPGIDAVELVVPVTVPAELGVATLSLRAMVRSTTRGGTLRNARYGAWGISGFLLFGFLGIGALRGASKKQRLV